MIIDCHCHVGVDERFGLPPARIEPYLARAKRAGIERTVVFPAFSLDYTAANARLHRVVRQFPQDLIGFAAVNPQRDAGRIERLIGTAVDTFGFRGLKVHGLDAYPHREVLDAVTRFGIPLLVDVVRRIEAVDAMATRYPETPIIIPHLGGFTDSWPTYRACIDRLCRYPNVYADTSGVRYFDAVVEAVRRAGPDKVLFGSDGPYLHPALELAKVQLLGLAPQDEAKIAGGNIARLLVGAGDVRLTAV